MRHQKLSRLFKRIAKVSITRSVRTSFTQRLPNTIEVENLRIAFNIDKTLGNDPNKASISIYNLSADTRAELQYSPLHVRLDAGYEDATARLFEGDVRWGASTHVGVDWRSDLQLGDGERSTKHARVRRSYKSGVGIKTVLAGIAKSMGLKLPRNIDQATDLSREFAAGVSIVGPAGKELTKALIGTGYVWSIQDGKLQILKQADIRPDQAAVISPENGLIGVPTLGYPQTAKGKPVLTARMLLYPRLTPGGKVQLDSNALKGDYKVLSVRHSGDTHGSDWFTVIEATPL